MLVHAKNRRGIIYIDNQPIYGREMGRDPVEIPYQIYDKYHECLEEGTYREAFLNAKFGGPFPPIAFTYSELRYLPLESLQKIAAGMKLDYKTFGTRKQLLENIKLILRDGTST